MSSQVTDAGLMSDTGVTSNANFKRNSQLHNQFINVQKMVFCGRVMSLERSRQASACCAILPCFWLLAFAIRAIVWQNYYFDDCVVVSSGKELPFSECFSCNGNSSVVSPDVNVLSGGFYATISTTIIALIIVGAVLFRLALVLYLKRQSSLILFSHGVFVPAVQSTRDLIRRIIPLFLFIVLIAALFQAVIAGEGHTVANNLRLGTDGTCVDGSGRVVRPTFRSDNPSSPTHQAGSAPDLTIRFLISLLPFLPVFITLNNLAQAPYSILQIRAFVNRQGLAEPLWKHVTNVADPIVLERTLNERGVAARRSKTMRAAGRITDRASGGILSWITGQYSAHNFGISWCRNEEDVEAMLHSLHKQGVVRSVPPAGDVQMDDFGVSAGDVVMCCRCLGVV